MDHRVGKISLRPSLSDRVPFRGAGILRASSAAIVLYCASLIMAQGLVENSPFAPAQQGQAGGSKPEGSLQLCGVSESGGKVMICLVDSIAKRSRWISVGDTLEGITALSYRADSETALVRVGPVLQSLTLRGSTVQSAMAEKTSSKEAKRLEREARMFVSDIVDVGVEQRKSKEKSSHKAAKTSQKAENPGP